jgi:hypothetical protein
MIRSILILFSFYPVRLLPIGPLGGTTALGLAQAPKPLLSEPI